MEGKLQDVFRAAAELAASPGGVLATVVRARGSTPQVVGAKLLLRPDGRFVGTTGGGAVEAAVLADAETVRSRESPLRRTYQLGADLGMCCGGTMDVLLEPVTMDHAEIWSELGRLEETGDAGAYAVVLGETGVEAVAGAKVVASRTGLRAVGVAEGPFWEWLRRDLESLLEGGAPRVDSYIAPGGREIDVYFEPVVARPRLVIFGGGHVARPLAHLGSMLGFRVVVVDDRVDWASRERFPDADLVVNEPYVDFLFRFDHRASDYLVIVTRGHEFDQEVLEAVIARQYRYLGMIGARRKVKRAFLRLETAGFLPGLLERVRAPIGLNIGSETPEEIAVAIAAELILERRGAPRAGVQAPGWWREP